MIQWLVESAQNMTEPPEAFLSAAELERFSSFRFEKRRRDWLLGRWTAKRLLQAVLLEQTHEMVPRDAIEIFNDAGGAPHISDPRGLWEVLIARNLQGLNLSLSHSSGFALGAVSAGIVGADIEIVTTREEYIVDDYFTAEEHARVHAQPPAQRDLVVTAIWSAKEAVLKALRHGLRVDTRTVEISIAPFEDEPSEWTPYGIGRGDPWWSPLSGDPSWSPQSSDPARSPLGWDPMWSSLGTNSMRLPLWGWWRAQDGFVLTVACSVGRTPQEIPLTPESVLVSAGDLHEGHGVLPRRIAQATRHHARHGARD